MILSIVGLLSPCGVASPTTDTVTLQRLQLCEQVRQLQRANAGPPGVWHYFVSVAPFLTALAAVAAIVVSWSKQRQDAREQRESDRTQHDQESLHRFDAAFASAITNLGSTSEPLQA